MDESTPNADAVTLHTVDALQRVADGEIWDPVEERDALASVERSLFSSTPEPIRLSRYLLLRPLGSGGAGVVYEAYDGELARRVAVKVLRSSSNDHESAERARLRFVREAQAIARLSHPNVIAVHDVGTYTEAEFGSGRAGGRGGVFIVMELVEGQDLAAWLESEARSWRDVIAAFVDAGRGVAAAHAAGIVHRDFKPGNVLVGARGAVKVVDFGLALAHGDSDAPGAESVGSWSGSSDDGAAWDKLTRTGTLLGTPPYMAPEQHRGDAADEHADQFAFCASLFRALYGDHAFAGRSLEVLSGQKAKGNVRHPPPSSDVPLWIHRAIVRGLQPEPTARFGSMNALLAALLADPVRRAKRVAGRAAVVVGAAALAYSGWYATRPGQVVVRASAGGQPLHDVRVTLDDEELVDGKGTVSPGLYRVVVTAPDHEPSQTVLEVARGRTHELELELQHEQAVLKLGLEPAATHVLIDGVDHGSRPQGFDIDTGRHEVVLRHFGYVDHRMDWDASVGQTHEEFVALRKALVWSRPATGVYRLARWIGDASGDGLVDLMQRRFTRLTAYDPWNDRELWRIELGANPYFRQCDVDGDGVADVLTVRATEAANEVVAFDGATRQRRPSPRWRWSKALEGDAITDLAPELACVQAEGSAHDVIVAAGPDRLHRLDGRTGVQRFATTIDGAVASLATLRRDDGSTLTVAVGPDRVTAIDGAGAVVWHNDAPVATRGDDGATDAGWLEFVAEARKHERPWAVAASLGGAGDDLVLYRAAAADEVELVALSAVDGSARWRRPTAELGALRSGLEIGDVDDDGVIEIAARAPDDPLQLSLVDGATGVPRWTRRLSQPAGAQVLVGLQEPRMLLRRDNRLELLDARDGATIGEVETLQRLTAFAAVADWNGDTRPDIITGTSDGFVRVYDAALQPIGTVPIGVPISSVIADTDANRDGFVDLLAQARGPAVLVGPKIRWERRPLDTIRATPVVADLDDDGQPEVAVVGTLAAQRRLQILDARTGMLEASSEAGETPDVIRPPVVMRRAGAAELLAVGRGVSRFSGGNAARLDRYRTPPAYASPTLGDVDGDGVDEVVMVTWGPGVVHVLEADDLSLRWSAPFGEQGAFGAPVVTDVDGDGAPDIVVAALDGRVVLLDGAGGIQWQTQTGGRLNFAPTVADLDGDGTPEVVVAPQSDDDPLVVLRGTDGALEQRWPKHGSRRARPLAVDVDDDGSPEIISSTHTNGVVSLDGRGAVRWRYGFVDVDGLQPEASGSPIVADLEGDGRLEVIAGFDHGSVHTLSARDGRLIWRFQSGREEIEASPAVADVDGDGQLEVFVAGHDRRLTCLDHRPAAR